MKSTWNSYIVLNGVWITALGSSLENKTNGSPNSLSTDDMVVCVSHHQHGRVVGTGGAPCLLQEGMVHQCYSHSHLSLLTAIVGGLVCGCTWECVCVCVCVCYKLLVCVDHI